MAAEKLGEGLDEQAVDGGRALAARLLDERAHELRIAGERFVGEGIHSSAQRDGGVAGERIH
jgi:hypothetical protein